MTTMKRQLSDKSAAQVPDALVRAAILHTLGEVTLTFDGLCRTLECNSAAAREMVRRVHVELLYSGKIERAGFDGGELQITYRVPK